MGLIFNGNGDVIRAVDGSLTVEGIDLGGSANINAGIATFSGNVNVGGVLTYEDVKNVDSVGIITAREGIKINADNKSLLIGASGDLRLIHDGSNSFVDDSGTGALRVRGSEVLIQKVSSTENMFRGVADGAVELYYDAAKKLETLTNGIRVTGQVDVNGGGISLEDSRAVYLGTGDDMEIFYDGTDGYIRNHSGGRVIIRGRTGLLFQTNATGGGADDAIKCIQNGAVELYWDNSKKFWTKTDGAEVDGTFDADRVDCNGLFHIQYGTSTNTNYMSSMSNNNGIMHLFRGDGLFIGNNMNTSNQSGGPNNKAIELKTDGALTAVTGTFSGALSGTTGTFSGDIKTTAATVNIKSGSSINTNSDTSAHGALHKNTTSGEFAIVSGGTGGTNHLTFYTSASAAPTEKLRISHDGRLLLGTQKTYGSASYYDDITINNSNGSGASGGTGITLISSSNSWASIYLGDSDNNGIGAIKYDHNSNSMRLVVNAIDPALLINSSGNVMIGDSDTDNAVTDSDNLVIGANSGDNGMTIVSGSGNYNGSIRFSDGANSGSDAIRGVIQYYHGHDYMRFYTNATERFRIDSSGRMLLGKTDGNCALDINSSHYVVTSSGRSTTGINIDGSPGNANEYGGGISFQCGATGAAAISGVQNSSDADVVGLAFFTHSSSSGSDNAEERVRITADGKVYFGATANIGAESWLFRKDVAGGGDGCRLTLYNADNSSVNNQAKLCLKTNHSETIFSTFNQGELYVSNPHSASYFVMYLGGAERLRIMGSSGDMRGGDNPDSTLWDAGNNAGWYYRRGQGSFQTATRANTGYSAFYINKNTGAGGSEDRRYVDFYWNSSHYGRIEYNGASGVNYNTSSDYRLKENNVPITDGIAKVKQLKPYRFNFKTDDPSTVVQGFFAHEAQEVVPYAVSGTKDQVVTQAAVDEGSQPEEKSVGDPIYQDLDYGKLTPILTAALKEAIAKIEVLEAKVAALES